VAGQIDPIPGTHPLFNESILQWLNAPILKGSYDAG
jgi:hypothetical protein